jgi:hypothetical protein
MLTLISISLLILIPAATWWFGLWNNLITLVNCTLAALIATTAFPPIADMIVRINAESFSMLSLFVAVWLCFFLAFVVLRGITESISRYQLKFDPITEMAGRSVLSLLTAIVFICFTHFTLQMAPLDGELFGDGGLTVPATGSAADRAWVGYVDYASTGPLAAGERFSTTTFYKRASSRRWDIDFEKKMRTDAGKEK